MTEEKPRLARLAAIVTQLQSRSLVTARDLADKHGISIRTVYRDIRTLQKSGVPVITEEGRGYSIMDGFNLPPVRFSEEEAMALLTAEQLVRKNKDQSLIKHYETAAIKIKSTLRLGDRNRSEFLESRLQVRNNMHQERTSDYLIKVQAAITNFDVVQLEYISVEGYESNRKIEPFAIYTTQDNWILIAFCQSRQDFRAFRLDRFQRFFKTGEKFEPHDMTLEQYLNECRKKWQGTDGSYL